MSSLFAPDNLDIEIYRILGRLEIFTFPVLASQEHSVVQVPVFVTQKSGIASPVKIADFQPAQRYHTGENKMSRGLFT